MYRVMNLIKLPLISVVFLNLPLVQFCGAGQYWNG
jgi:hypothetical protein